MQTAPAVPKVFITGAAGGIGEALARAYAARGAQLGVFSRRAEPLQALQQEFGADRVAVYTGDVRVAADLQRAADQFLERFGCPDVVIGNAGISRGTATDIAEDLVAFEAIMATNVNGLVHTFHPFVAAMRQARRGRLVGIASVAGFRGLPGSSAYSASKAAAISYLESLRLEMRDANVAVVTICPGYIDTPMTKKNPYRMPFLLAPEEAARRMLRVIDAGTSFAVVPWQMGMVGRVLKLLPNWLYDRLFANAPRKPRDAKI